MSLPTPCQPKIQTANAIRTLIPTPIPTPTNALPTPSLGTPHTPIALAASRARLVRASGPRHRLRCAGAPLRRTAPPLWCSYIDQDSTNARPPCFENQRRIDNAMCGGQLIVTSTARIFENVPHCLPVRCAITSALPQEPHLSPDQTLRTYRGRKTVADALPTQPAARTRRSRGERGRHPFRILKRGNCFADCWLSAFSYRICLQKH
jgi:hypothetical protein